MSEAKRIELDQLSIQAWDLDRLKPAPNNHKNHTEESAAKLAKSLADLGQLQAILVDKDCEIIAGHGRLMAARKLGWDKVKVVQLPIDRATAIKARIADNLMSNQDIDTTKLRAELEEVLEIDGELDLGSLIADDGLEKLVDMDLKIELDSSSISDDPLGDAETMANESEEIIREAGASDVKLAKVFGFDRVTSEQSITLKDFMAVVMDERSETEPADALVAWVEEVLA